MALIDCPECKKTISDKAPTCPHCGAPINNNIKVDFNEKIEKVNDLLEGIQKFKLIIKYNYPKVDLILLFISLFVIPLASDRSGFFPHIAFLFSALKSNDDYAIYMKLIYLFPFVYNLKQMIISYRSSKIMDLRLGDLVVVIAMFSITIMTYSFLRHSAKDSISNIGIAIILILSFLVFVGFVKSFELKRKEMGLGEVLKSLFRKSIVDSVSFYLVSLFLILRYIFDLSGEILAFSFLLFSFLILQIYLISINYFNKNSKLFYFSIFIFLLPIINLFFPISIFGGGISYSPAIVFIVFPTGLIFLLTIILRKKSSNMSEDIETSVESLAKIKSDNNNILIAEEKKYKIVFNGEIVPDADLNDVKNKLSALFKMDIAKIERLFIGKPTIIKKDIDLGKAEKIKDTLFSVGAICEVKEYNGQLS